MDYEKSPVVTAVKHVYELCEGNSQLSAAVRHAVGVLEQAFTKYGYCLLANSQHFSPFS